MPGITEVKTLVTDGEIGDLIVSHGQGQRNPIVYGGVFYFVVTQRALLVGNGTMADLTTPTFGKRNDN